MPAKSRRRIHLDSLQRVIKEKRIAKFQKEVPGELVTDSLVDIEVDFESNFEVDGVVWSMIADCDDDDDNNDTAEMILLNDMSSTEVSGHLEGSIEMTVEKRWRAFGDNFNIYGHGTSKSTYYRKRSEKLLMQKSHKKGKTIDSFYKHVENKRISIEEEIDKCHEILGELPPNKHLMTEDEAMTALLPLVSNSRASSSVCNSLKPWEINRARAVFKYFSLLGEGVKRMDASAITTSFLYPIKRNNEVMSVEEAITSYKARSIRNWGEEYLLTGEFPQYSQGKHVKTFSVFNNEMNQATFLTYLRNCTDIERTPENFMKKCNDTQHGILKGIKGAPTKICYNTSKRWMVCLGFKPTVASKGWYTDSHERPDIVASREDFLRQMEIYDRRMRHFKGEDMQESIPPQLHQGEKECVLITHDESTFYCNEGRRFFWLENGKKKLLPKSKGTSLMISGFCCQCHGFMSHSGAKSYQVFKAGTGREGWFTNQHLVDQFNLCLPVLNHFHPDCELLVAFDNSMTHRARAPDGLDATRLNKVSHFIYLLT